MTFLIFLLDSVALMHVFCQDLAPVTHVAGLLTLTDFLAFPISYSFPIVVFPKITPQTNSHTGISGFALGKPKLRYLHHLHCNKTSLHLKYHIWIMVMTSYLCSWLLCSCSTLIHSLRISTYHTVVQKSFNAFALILEKQNLGYPKCDSQDSSRLADFASSIMPCAPGPFQFSVSVTPASFQVPRDQVLG